MNVKILLSNPTMTTDAYNKSVAFVLHVLICFIVMTHFGSLFLYTTSTIINLPPKDLNLNFEEGKRTFSVFFLYKERHRLEIIGKLPRAIHFVSLCVSKTFSFVEFYKSVLQVVRAAVDFQETNSNALPYSGTFKNRYMLEISMINYLVPGSFV